MACGHSNPYFSPIARSAPDGAGGCPVDQSHSYHRLPPFAGSSYHSAMLDISSRRVAIACWAFSGVSNVPMIVKSALWLLLNCCQTDTFILQTPFPLSPGRQIGLQIPSSY